MAARGALVLCGLFAFANLAACGPSATPVPAVTVHVVNRTSNLVVTGVSLHPEGGALGTAPLIGYDFVPPCGGELRIRAPIQNADLGGGGALGLAIDPDGELDRDHPGLYLDPASAPRYGLSIFWSNGELREGEWITVTPTEVVRSDNPSPTPGASEPCELLTRDLLGEAPAGE